MNTLEVTPLRLLGNRLVQLFVTVLATAAITIEFTPNESPKVSITQPTQAQITNSITYSDFQRLTINMSLTQVERILGTGVKIEQSIDITVYQWGDDNGEIIAEFDQNQQLINFKQQGLTKK